MGKPVPRRMGVYGREHGKEHRLACRSRLMALRFWVSTTIAVLGPLSNVERRAVLLDDRQLPCALWKAIEMAPSKRGRRASPPSPFWRQITDPSGSIYPLGQLVWRPVEILLLIAGAGRRQRLNHTTT